MIFDSILCIFPIDETTDSLIPVWDILSSSDNFKGLRLNHDDDEYRNALNEIRNSNERTLIVFLGHGSSHCLYGCLNENGQKYEFITQNESDLFIDKNLFALACRSNDFIERLNGIYGPKVSIGFGGLPSEWIDVLSERDDNHKAYPGIVEEDIEYFRDTFIRIIVKSLSLVLKNEESLFDVKSHLRLLISKEIAELLTEHKVNNYRALADLFFEVKSDILCLTN